MSEEQKKKIADDISEIRTQVEKVMFKSNVLKELFAGLAVNACENGGASPIEDFTLFTESIKSLLDEIVTEAGEASDSLSFMACTAAKEEKEREV